MFKFNSGSIKERSALYDSNTGALKPTGTGSTFTIYPNFNDKTGNATYITPRFDSTYGH